MKKILLFVISLFMFSSIVSAQTDTSDPGGFLVFPWETSYTELSKERELAEVTHIFTIDSTEKTKSFIDVEASNDDIMIIYAFRNNKLVQGRLVIDKKEAHGHFLEALSKQLGEPEKTEDSFIWRKKTTLVFASDFDEATKGQVTFFYAKDPAAQVLD